MKNKEKNAERFMGFADVYDGVRPSVPQYPVDVICRYLGARPQLVVDLGCGTGLSSVIWQNTGSQVIGVEPSDDMYSIAKQKENGMLRFIKAYSDDTGLPDACADAVVCSQSFHWMEPASTLKEVNRLLKKGGVFAAIDYDWPPVSKWQAEQAYMRLYKRIREIETQVPEIKETHVRYSKDNHLHNIRSSGYFSYVREVLFSNAEACTKERFKKLILSQGGVQMILKKQPAQIEKDIFAFYKSVDQIFDNEAFQISFCYRMRIGVK